MAKSDINRLDLNVLLVLAKDNAINELKGMTINEINSYYGDDEMLLSARPNLCVYTDQIEHTARRFSAWLPPIQCTLSGHQCMMLIQV